MRSNLQHKPLARLSTSLAVALALFSATSLTWAIPAQEPLVARTAPQPPVNLMITIDDSASMLFDFMPEGYFTVNSKSIRLGNSSGDWTTWFWPVGFIGDKPRENTDVATHVYNDDWSRGSVGGTASTKVYVGADKSNNVYPMQFRSPDVNPLYYNPDKRYRPWLSATDPTTEMSPGVFTAAKFDPRFSSTLALDTVTSTKANWCFSYNSCSYVTSSWNKALVYRLTSGADPTKTASYVRYDLNARNGDTWAPAVKHPNRTDCAGTRCTQDEEKQNFANWFTYHRTRIAIFKGALGRALANYQDKIRVGWALFNYSNGHVDSSGNIQRKIAQMDLSTLKTTLADIYNIDADHSTPSRTTLDVIGQYFKKIDTTNPWRTTPSSSEVLSCRRSANFMMTDGYYNDDYSSAGNVDGQDGSVIGTAYPGGNVDHYIAAKPFSDSYSNTMADVAMQYFVNDLQPATANKILPVEGDIAYWQHLTQYMVGLGVKGVLDSSTPAAKAATLAAIKAGTLSWPDPGTNTTSGRIDDMWHAAVNTGGDFYSVNDSEELSAAIAESLGKAAGREAKEAGVAVSSETVVSGSLKLVPKYNSSAWTGGLDAYTLSSNGTATTSPTWSASIPAWATRQLFTWTGTAPEVFDYDTLSGTNKTTMGSKALVDWVRGDTSNEDATDPYRSRGGAKFGDFVDSSPVYIKEPIKLGYELIDASYSTYETLKAARTSSVVFLGGNDGIMHAFDGGTGIEVFGFLPQAGLIKLPLIAQKNYGTTANPHQYVIDGPAFETDAYIKPRGASAVGWTNVVIASMGAGGTGFFALHVPTTSPTALDSNAVMWEQSSANAGYGDDIGYIIGKMATGKIAGGGLGDGWKAFVGNGVDSKNGKAALLVVDLASGNIDKEIVVDSSGSNGLMGVSLIQDDKNAVIGAYAGDLKGNVWRFDFESPTDTAKWKVGFNGEPLFRAGQAITAAPMSFPRTPAVGRIVSFGTGRLISASDPDSVTVESVYGVLDDTPVGASSVGNPSPFEAVSVDRSKLASRTLSVTPTNINGTDYFTLTGVDIDWNTQLGWYFDLPITRQRMLLSPQRLASKYVLMQTVVPATTPVACEVSKGDGYTYIVDISTGRQLSDPIFDTNNDGTVGGGDAAFAGYKSTSGVFGATDIVSVDTSGSGSGGGGGGGGGGCTGDACTDPPPPKCPDGYELKFDAKEGKWMCLPTDKDPQLIVKDRIWRQILNPPQ